ncbi:MAG TPA: hypothetical protein VHE55_12810 [Fimbriimonadaceae bacterium]|nr:hypothetical protein [Fimbriimonadaceae bacterium]
MNPDNAIAAGSFGAILIFEMVLVVLMVVVYWKIATKAGYPGWYALAVIVPCLNLILFIAFAFSEWPIERELKHLRSLQSNQPNAYPRYPQSPTP